MKFELVLCVLATSCCMAMENINDGSLEGRQKPRFTPGYYKMGTLRWCHEYVDNEDESQLLIDLSKAVYEVEKNNRYERIADCLKKLCEFSVKPGTGKQTVIRNTWAMLDTTGVPELFVDLQHPLLKKYMDFIMDVLLSHSSHNSDF